MTYHSRLKLLNLKSLEVRRLRSDLAFAYKILFGKIPINSDAQGCVLAPALFAIAIDWILGHLAAHVGITLGRRHFTDLAYADDAVILLDNDISVVDALEKLCVEASTFGLKLSWPKTKLQNLGVGPPMNSVVIDNVTVEGVEKFIYLGSGATVLDQATMMMMMTAHAKESIASTRP